VWPDGSVLREASDANVYVIYGGAKWCIRQVVVQYAALELGGAACEHDFNSGT
jgi:hypothetical protein